MPSKIRYIYIAGPYTAGNTAENVRNAMEAWHTLTCYNLVPMCPHLSHFLHMHRPRHYEFWMEHDLAWIERCDALYRLPGASAGADREEAKATELGLPVFHSEEELAEYLFGEDAS